MGIKKISELEELKNLQTTDILPVVDVANGTTKKVEISTLLTALVEKMQVHIIVFIEEKILLIYSMMEHYQNKLQQELLTIYSLETIS